MPGNRAGGGFAAPSWSELARHFFWAVYTKPQGKLLYSVWGSFMVRTAANPPVFGNVGERLARPVTARISISSASSISTAPDHSTD